MHTTVRRFGLFVLCIGLFVIQLLPTPTSATERSALSVLSDMGADIATDSQSGVARFISLPVDTTHVRKSDTLNTIDAEQLARKFIQTHGAAFGNNNLALNLETISNHAVKANGNFIRFQQTYRKVPVIAGELNVHITLTHQVASMNGEVLPDIDVDTTPTITESAAEKIALIIVQKGYPNARRTLMAVRKGLWIFHPKLLGSPETPVTTLNWRFEVRDGAEVRALVLINAHTGATTLQFNQTAHVLDQRVCDANNTSDTDYNANNNCNSDAKSTRTNEITDTSKVDVDIAWHNAKATYEFYSSVLGRNSINDAGLKIISLVNYCPLGDSCPYKNAYWNGVQMTYGQTFASADDVVGHELTHGVTENTAGLFYYYQSGAINESLSDVFGELIDQSYSGDFVDAPADDWLMGEDLSIGEIRSMKNPGLFGDPDKMTSSKYNNGKYLGDLGDEGGVHSNSGVNNKAAYLMTDGGVFNGYTIGALGSTKVAKIYYHAMTNYLLSGSDYFDLGVSLNASCTDLLTGGLDSFVTTDCLNVKKAVLATEMAKTPPNAPATDATECTSSETKIDLYNDDFEVIRPTRWAITPASGSFWYYPTPSWSEYATSGHNSVSVLYQESQSDQKFSMLNSFFVPAGAMLTFRHAYEFEAYYNNDGTAITEAYDGGIVEYSTDFGGKWIDAKPLFVTNAYNASLIVSGNTNVLAGERVFTGMSNGFITSKLNLNSLSGKNIRFRFRATSDANSFGTGWFIDDVNAFRCLTSSQSAKTLTTGANTSCLTSFTNASWCWGENNNGQVGNMTNVDTTSAQALINNSGVIASGITQIAAGRSHSCAVTKTHTIQCWGNNSDGQIGDGTTIQRLGAVPTLKADKTPMDNQSLVTVGDSFSCALGSVGTVSCWGQNTKGQLGNGTTKNSRSPVTVIKAGGSALSSVKAISAGSEHTCALLNNGTVWCWGNNTSGATGSSLAANHGAVQVKNATGILTGITYISSGKQYSCALAGTIATWCWGLNDYGQLGDGTLINRTYAVPVKLGNTALINLVDIAAGNGAHTCAISSTGVGYCWGLNSSGQLSDGTNMLRKTAVVLSSASNALIGQIKDIAVGEAHSCALTNGGMLWCWGKNSSGQLGIGSNGAVTVPSRVKNAKGVFGE